MVGLSLSSKLFKVPEGFVIPRMAFVRIAGDMGLEHEIRRVYHDGRIKYKAEKIREFIRAHLWRDDRKEATGEPAFLKTLEKDVLEVYELSLEDDVSVVRAAAIMEHELVEHFYFEGAVPAQRTDRLQAIRNVWTEFFTDEVVDYIFEHMEQSKGVDIAQFYPSLLIQQRVKSRVSGFFSSIHLAANNWGEMVAVPAPGSAEWITSGKGMAPDIARINKKDGRIKEETLGNGRLNPALTDGEVEALADIAGSFEVYFGHPLLFKFSIGEDGNIYVFDMIPLSTIGESKRAAIRTTLTETSVTWNQKIATGEPAQNILVRFESDEVDLNAVIASGHIFVWDYENNKPVDFTVSVGHGERTLSIDLKGSPRKFWLKMGEGVGEDQEGQPITYVSKGNHVVLEPFIYVINVNDETGKAEVRGFYNLKDCGRFIESREQVSSPVAKKKDHVSQYAPAILRAIEVLKKYHDDRILTRYYLSGSFAGGRLHLPSHDVDFAVSISTSRQYFGNSIQNLLREMKTLSENAGIEFHVTLSAFGHVYRVAANKIEKTGEVRGEGILKAMPATEARRKRLIDLTSIDIAGPQDIVDLYRRIHLLNQIILAEKGRPSQQSPAVFSASFITAVKRAKREDEFAGLTHQFAVTVYPAPRMSEDGVNGASSPVEAKRAARIVAVSMLLNISAPVLSDDAVKELDLSVPVMARQPELFAISRADRYVWNDFNGLLEPAGGRKPLLDFANLRNTDHR